ncbi:arsenate reductase family protein [Metabacillus sp. GX 13764]|uniref:arsenate reductase family protein n=1 Tax=Metabacillus kandeliae TaxID=2900151 RepID=UPI001E2D2F0B|nr:arsenate reductase family protein [Metabacillus kandeliae]MCD7036292.1 arsenate reductase family protein [Metabacillus kandeliae]
MSLTFYWYPKCGTCRKAKKWLEEHGQTLQEVHIAENPPSKEDLKRLQEESGLELKKLFNTSGMKYRELSLKDKLPEMNEEEMLELLASDGMLIKRPITSDGKNATIGFKEEQFQEFWS